MKNQQQKQKDDLIFEIIKGSSPFKYEKRNKQQLINKIKQFKLNEKKSLLEMKKSILITKDNPLTPSKLEKRVSFIDEEEKKRQEQERIRRKLFEQKMKEEQQKNQLKRSIQATHSKVQCMIDNLYSNNHSNLGRSQLRMPNVGNNHQFTSKIETVSNLSSFYPGMTGSIYQSKSSIKYRHETAMKKQSQCQTVPIQNQPRQIIIKYRYGHDQNPETQSPVKHPQRIKSSPKILQSTVFSVNSPNSNSRYRDKPIKLSYLEQTQSQFGLQKNQSISELSKNKSNIDFQKSKKHKSVVSLHQERSQWAKNLSLNKCRHEIDVELMKHRLWNKIDDSTSKNTNRSLAKGQQ